jgi:Glyoxalase/Bleomycin resistance protein/Dioxygenase superfamily
MNTPNTPNPPTTALQIFGELRQLAWVVPKGTFEKHVDHWVNSLGVGPWIVVEKPPVINVVHRGQPSHLDFSFAIAHMGTIQVEIIEQHDDAPTTYSEFMTATNGEGGLHHIAFWPDDIEAAQEQVKQLGWSLVTSAQIGERARFRYYDTPNPLVGMPSAPTMELAEVKGAGRDYFLNDMAQLSRTFDPTTQSGILRRGMSS